MCEPHNCSNISDTQRRLHKWIIEWFIALSAKLGVCVRKRKIKPKGCTTAGERSGKNICSSVSSSSLDVTVQLQFCCCLYQAASGTSTRPGLSLICGSPRRLTDAECVKDFAGSDASGGQAKDCMHNIDPQ